MGRKPNILVVGLFWGDEGKAKIVDFLTDDANLVLRYQGGANAGHSVEIDGERFVLHQVPTGILHPGKLCVLGAGMVLDLPALLDELEGLRRRGVEWRGRLLVSPRAHLVLPHHKIMEQVQDERAGIGTTRRGIGPAYMTKAARIGIRVGDALVGREHLTRLLDRWLAEIGSMFERAHNVSFPPTDEVVDEILRSAEALRGCIKPISPVVDDVARRAGGVLAEGAQGTMLSINWGTYPFVTSSETTAGGASEGVGVDIRLFDTVIGVAKAFCTRVGNGPFPTEGDDALQSRLRGTGEHAYDEFGSTTGRPRRCGWLDGVILRYSCRINGVDAVALTKLDVLSGIDPLMISVEYEGYKTVPATSAELGRVKPRYETLPGWQEDISHIRSFDALPENARRYVAFVEKLAGAPVKYIGVGPGRNDIIVRNI